MELRKRRPTPRFDDAVSLDVVLNIVERCRRVIIFTGSGISAASGMSMFSTSNGLYERARKRFKVQDGIKLFTYSFYRQRRAEVQAFFAQIYSEAQASQAAISHHAMAQLRRMGALQRHYTLNIDGLSEVVGLDTWHHEYNPCGSTVEMHGNIRQLVCPTCHAVELLNRTNINLMRAQQPVPCSACGKDQLRFKVMLYDDGEGECITPEHVFDVLEQDLKTCDMVVWAGISFQQSASVEYFRRVRHTLGTLGRLQAVPQVLVNPSEDPYFNLTTALSNPRELQLLDLRETSDVAFSAIVQRLQQAIANGMDVCGEAHDAGGGGGGQLIAHEGSLEAATESDGSCRDGIAVSMTVRGMSPSGMPMELGEGATSSHAAAAAKAESSGPVCATLSPPSAVFLQQRPQHFPHAEEAMYRTISIDPVAAALGGTLAPPSATASAVDTAECASVKLEPPQPSSVRMASTAPVGRLEVRGNVARSATPPAAASLWGTCSPMLQPSNHACHNTAAEQQPLLQHPSLTFHNYQSKCHNQHYRQQPSLPSEEQQLLGDLLESSRRPAAATPPLAADMPAPVPSTLTDPLRQLASVKAGSGTRRSGGSCSAKDTWGGGGGGGGAGSGEESHGGGSGGGSGDPLFVDDEDDEDYCEGQDEDEGRCRRSGRAKGRGRGGSKGRGRGGKGRGRGAGGGASSQQGSRASSLGSHGVGGGAGVGGLAVPLAAGGVVPLVANQLGLLLGLAPGCVLAGGALGAGGGGVRAAGISGAQGQLAMLPLGQGALQLALVQQQPQQVHAQQQVMAPTQPAAITLQQLQQLQLLAQLQQLAHLQQLQQQRQQQQQQLQHHRDQAQASGQAALQQQAGAPQHQHHHLPQPIEPTAPVQQFPQVLIPQQLQQLLPQQQQQLLAHTHAVSLASHHSSEGQVRGLLPHTNSRGQMQEDAAPQPPPSCTSGAQPSPSKVLPPLGSHQSQLLQLLQSAQQQHQQQPRLQQRQHPEDGQLAHRFTGEVRAWWQQQQVGLQPQADEESAPDHKQQHYFQLHHHLHHQQQYQHHQQLQQHALEPRHHHHQLLQQEPIPAQQHAQSMPHHRTTTAAMPHGHMLSSGVVVPAADSAVTDWGAGLSVGQGNIARLQGGGGGAATPSGGPTSTEGSGGSVGLALAGSEADGLAAWQ